jgi:hypothetical protein
MLNYGRPRSVSVALGFCHYSDTETMLLIYVDLRKDNSLGECERDHHENLSSQACSQKRYVKTKSNP